MPDLSPDQFFHGTKAVIKDGMVRPANDVDRHVSEHSMGDPGDMSEGDHAFAIRNDERYAWHAAQNLSNGSGRPKVYTVEPAADQKPGPWNAQHPDWLAHVELDDPTGEFPPHKDDIHAAVYHNSQDEWASPTGFKVTGRHDIMPGRQGTFPGINWNRHSDRAWVDTNHPDRDQVRYGMAGLDGLSKEIGRSRKVFEEGATRHDWNNDQAPHSALREMAGRPQKRIATLFD